MRLLLYSLVSFAAAIAIVANAMLKRGQFYPAVIYLSTSKLSLMVMGNAIFTTVVLLGKTAKVVFFGTLREVEIEQMYDKAWSALIEMCIAMTIFREEFSTRFVALATALSFVKIFHWLTEHRLEYIEQAYLQLPRSAHLRIASLMVLLTALDVMCVQYAVTKTLEKGPSVLLLFAFEYVVLLATMLTLFIKYLIHCADMRREGRWDAKGMYIFYLQLVSDLFQLFVYMIFFLIVCAYYGLPLHIIRDLYLTYTNFKRRITQYLHYRRLSRVLEKYPDVSAQELEDGDSTCIICREEMVTAKKLPCGHMFHVHCLRQWLELQTTCPTCRRSVWQQLEPPAQEAMAGAPAQMPDMQLPGGAMPVPQGGAPGQPPVRVQQFANPADLAGHARQHAVQQGQQQVPHPGQQPGAERTHTMSWTVVGSGQAAQNLFQQPHAPAEQQTLSNETLKLHIEWQIESLQNLLQQVEKRMKAEEDAAVPEAENAQNSTVAAPEAMGDGAAPEGDPEAAPLVMGGGILGNGLGDEPGLRQRTNNQRAVQNDE